jgi:ABC-2 type transport system ATP-binding protein
VVIYYGGRIQAQGSLKELLANPDAVRITMPPVSRETMEKVLELVGRAAAGKVEVDTPTRNLESYFLEVVRKARENMSETSGATSGSTVAAYLRGDAEAAPAADRILERLTVPTAPAAAAPAPPPAPARPVDEARLEGLAKPAGPRPPAAPPAPTPAPPVDLGKANEKLSALLGRKDENK